MLEQPQTKRGESLGPLQLSRRPKGGHRSRFALRDLLDVAFVRSLKRTKG
jgi:hypothetical protein